MYCCVVVIVYELILIMMGSVGWFGWDFVALYSLLFVLVCNDLLLRTNNASDQGILMLPARVWGLLMVLSRFNLFYLRL